MSKVVPNLAAQTGAAPRNRKPATSTSQSAESTAASASESAAYDSVEVSAQPATQSIDPEAIHMTQVANATYNPGGRSRSRDCGPTSLAMALSALGLEVPGDSGGSVQERINRTREVMGAPGSGNTDLQQIEAGARASGADTRYVSGLAQISEAVANGEPVVLLGNTMNGGSYGSRTGIDSNGGHFITVSGYDPQTDSYTINDPLSHGGPIQVSASELESYANGSRGLALSRADGQAVEPSQRPVGVAPPNESRPSPGNPGPNPGSPGAPCECSSGPAHQANGIHAVQPQFMEEQGLEQMLSQLCDQILSSEGQGPFPEASQDELEALLLMLVLFVEMQNITLPPQLEDKVADTLEHIESRGPSKPQGDAEGVWPDFLELLEAFEDGMAA